jgi:para-nitrobenzyl esterase
MQIMPPPSPAWNAVDKYFTGGGPNIFERANEKQSEDCLVLNVATASLRGKRPVMVYIHGGGFAIGNGIWVLGASKLVQEEEVVIVGLNHRLNVFGYTYLGGFSEKYADSGNVGQMDLIAALEWVRANIASFGGDPHNVTIFGESGGGAKISTLLAMPRATGLFHRAIIESGSLLRVSTQDEATKRASELLKTLGLSERQVDELQKIPAEKLLAANLPSGPLPSIRGLGAQPVVDGRSIPQQTWTPVAPKTAAGVSMIIGNCKDESTMFLGWDQSLFTLDEPGLREREVKAGIPELEVDKLLALYHRDYPKDSPSDLYFRISADRTARANVMAQADRKLAGGGGNVYVYNFAWNTPVLDGRLRAFHASELPLAFRKVAYPESEELSRQIAGAWASFARNGDPGHKGLPNWPAYSTTDRPTMVFDAGNTQLINNPAKEELAILQKYPTDSLL